MNIWLVIYLFGSLVSLAYASFTFKSMWRKYWYPGKPVNDISGWDYIVFASAVVGSWVSLLATVNWRIGNGYGLFKCEYNEWWHRENG